MDQTMANNMGNGLVEAKRPKYFSINDAIEYNSKYFQLNHRIQYTTKYLNKHMNTTQQKYIDINRENNQINENK